MWGQRRHFPRSGASRATPSSSAWATIASPGRVTGVDRPSPSAGRRATIQSMMAIRGIVPMLLAALLAGCAHHPPGSPPDTGSIAGRVLGGGAPIESSRVTVTGIPGEVLVQPDGSFSIGKMPAGNYVVTAGATSFWTDEDTVRVENGRVTAVTFNLSLKPGILRTGTIAGTVLDVEGGNPLQYANISILNAVGWARTGPSGRYSIVVLVGTYAVRVKMVGFVPQTRDSVQVKEGQTTTVDFKLKFKSTITPQAP